MLVYRDFTSRTTPADRSVVPSFARAFVSAGAEVFWHDGPDSFSDYVRANEVEVIPLLNPLFFSMLWNSPDLDVAGSQPTPHAPSNIIKAAGEVHAIFLAEDGVHLIDFPSQVRLDEHSMYHCSDGPAVVYRDETLLYALHGRSVIPEAIEPGSEQLEAILSCPDDELRAMLMENFNNQGVSR